MLVTLNLNAFCILSIKIYKSIIQQASKHKNSKHCICTVEPVFVAIPE